MISLKNKKMLITGATGGIGGSLVKKFLSLDAEILATGTNSEKLENLKSSTPVQLAEKTITKPVVGAGAGAAIGAVAGGSLGVAGKLAGVMIAVNGGWILAPIGAVIGYLGFKAFNKKKDKTIVEDDFQLICFDIVSEPSTTNAYLSLSERKQREIRNNVWTKADRINRLINEVLDE